jgi:hypothetical protein
MPWHVLDRVGATLGVAGQSVETRYGEFLQATERAGLGVDLSPADRTTIRSASSLGAAHQALADVGRVVTMALLDRAIWRDAGDPEFAKLRQVERQRRQASREGGPCLMCAGLLAAEGLSA